MIPDSSGKKSWTLTFCLAVAVIYTPVALVIVTNHSEPKVVEIVGDFLIRAWTMTIGAFIARDTTKKVGEIVERVRGKK